MTLASGDSHPATAIGRDAPNDPAVIRIADARPRPATFADSSQVQVGDITLALWNPLGLRSSVTEGIVSAVRRSVPERSPGLSRTRADPAEYDGRCNAESLCSAGAVAQRVARRPTTTAHPAANVQSLIASCPRFVAPAERDLPHAKEQTHESQ